MKNFVYLCEDEFVYLATDAQLEFALGHIELAHLPESFRVKVGRTNDPVRRMGLNHRGSNPDISYLHVWYLPGNAQIVETALKRRYRDFAVPGTTEWFLMSQFEVEELKTFPAMAFNDDDGLPFQIGEIIKPRIA